MQIKNSEGSQEASQLLYSETGVGASSQSRTETRLSSLFPKVSTGAHSRFGWLLTMMATGDHLVCSYYVSSDAYEENMYSCKKKKSLLGFQVDP